MFIESVQKMRTVAEYIFVWNITEFEYHVVTHWMYLQLSVDHAENRSLVAGE